MKNRILSTILALSLILSSFVAFFTLTEGDVLLPVSAASGDEITLPKAAGTVTIDGTLDADEWKSSLKVTGLDAMTWVHGYGAYFDADSAVMMMWDENYLYIGYVGYNYSGNAYNGGGNIIWNGGLPGERIDFMAYSDASDAGKWLSMIGATPYHNGATNAHGYTQGASGILAFERATADANFTCKNLTTDNIAVTEINDGTNYVMEYRLPWANVLHFTGATTAAVDTTFFARLYIGTGNAQAPFLNPSTDGVTTNKIINKFKLVAADVADDSGNDNVTNTIPQAAGTVTIDGTLDADEWKSSLKVTGLNEMTWTTYYQGSDYFNESSAFMMMWDADYLYVAFVGRNYTGHADNFNGGAKFIYDGGAPGDRIDMDFFASAGVIGKITDGRRTSLSFSGYTQAGSSSQFTAGKANAIAFRWNEAGVYQNCTALASHAASSADGDTYVVEAKLPWANVMADATKTTAALDDVIYSRIAYGSGNAKIPLFNTDDGVTSNLIVNEFKLGAALVADDSDDDNVTNDYTASLGTTYQEVTEGQDVTFTVTVDNVFASGEITLTFDPAVLSFKSTTAKASELADGTLKLATYGEDGQTTIEVVFTAVAVADSTTVTLTKAAFSTAEKAETEDLTAAEIGTASATVAVIADTYVVTLGDNLATLDNKTGAITVANGTALSFKVADAYTALYTDIVVKAGDEVLTAVEGVYTIDHAAAVTVTGTPKTFGVTVNGDDNTLVTVAPAAPVYGTDFVVTLPDNKSASLTDNGYTYSAVITIDGETYATVTEKVTTIPGAEITGDVVITVTKTEVLKTGVSITVTGDVTVAGDYASTATKGEAYTLTITPAAGYTYTVTAKVNGVAVDLAKAGNAYTVAAADVTGDITFEITATVVTEGLSVNKYLALNGTNMWLVKMVGDLAEDKVYKYGDTVMAWSDNYDAYVCLVISAETPDLELAIVDGDVATIDYTNDINGTEVVDANDAQFVYNMYMAMYSDFSSVSMEKFLLADVNADSVVDVADAAAIVAAILA